LSDSSCDASASLCSSNEGSTVKEEARDEASVSTYIPCLLPIRDSVKSRCLQALLQQRKGWEINLFRTKKLPKPMNPPISMSYDGVIILYLDENYRIDRVDFLGSEVASL
jgi:hypothetical protein